MPDKQQQQRQATDPVKTFQITTKPGIQRDGTTIDTELYNDGEWVRFTRQSGRPRKMGGYRSVSSQFSGPNRGSFTWSRNGITSILNCTETGIEECRILDDGSGSAVIERLDGSTGAFEPSSEVLWQIDSLFDAASGSDGSIVVAHPGHNLKNIDSDVGTYPVMVKMTAYTGYQSVFRQVNTPVPVSGGIVAIAPFLVAYGSDGYVAWCNENEPQNWSTGSAGNARITGSKIVKALPLRGGGQSPAALLWSLDSVFRMYYIGGTAIFKFDPLSSQSSVLSSSSFVEYDGKYYWAGVDRFLMFNGAVQELVNNVNLNFFYDNLNFAQRQKVWATKVTKFGEIWWFFPKGDATECNHAVIYNIRLNTWYDTPISRSSGVSAQVFYRPIWFENNADGTTKCWVHEEGWDRIEGENATAIKSFFETADFGFPTGGSDSEKPIGVNRWTRVTRVEPDFVMDGNMSLQVTGNEFAQIPAYDSKEFIFNKNTGKIDLREQRREIRLKFISDDLGGYYDAGKILMHLDVGDVRS